MYLTSSDITSFNEEALNRFIERKIPEGLYLDYKRDLSKYESKETTYREFLKDVTGFANANGGDILIGVREPEENLSCQDQIIGLDEGKALNGDLERLASSSIDPRIPGLQILPIALSNGRYIILVHIPPSLGRPHMVNHQKHRAFYIRHWESTFPMTTHEIRESVLSSVSAETRAKNYIEIMERDAIEYYQQGSPMILMQAMPLIPLEQPWDMTKDEIIEIIRGNSRYKKYSNFGLDSPIKPRLTIDGLQGRNERNDPDWITEIHRNGYIFAGFRNKKKQLSQTEQEGYFLHEGICTLFRAYFDLCSELQQVTETDLPYILKCKYLEARGTKLYYGFPRLSEPYIKNWIIWPDQIRQVGEDFIKIADIWCEQMFHAFDREKPA